ncbi:MAG: acetate--CoA ligase [Methanomassiliicoccaceae archaeon]|jgi:acetyl-CoA synthetase|nr:acetate--CoA ligase [Methanomassiliicoccaceae archaeon]
MTPENTKGQYLPSDEYRKTAMVKSVDEYTRLYSESMKDPVAYWVKQAEHIDWFSKGWKEPFTWNKKKDEFTWFKGGKLNVSYNCLDRHVKNGLKNTAAIIFQGEDDKDVRVYTYGQLLHEVERFSNVLKKNGVKKGDRVAVYLPMIPELAITLLACTRVGAIHSVVFAGFSSDAIFNRVADCTPKVLVTSDGSYRAGKKIDMKGKVNEILERDTSVEHVLVVKHTGADVVMEKDRDVWWHEEMEKVPLKCEPEVMDAEDPLFMLYTSGTTGKPKGMVHVNGGYLVGVNSSFRYIFNYNPGQVYWCTADIGWITGHSSILYGPLSVGATTLMFEGVPNYPENDRFWQVAEKWKVDIFYTAPTALRMIRKNGDDWIKKHDLSSLKMLASVGEPIDADVWKWYHRVIGGGRCPIADTWWQTETGSIIIAPLTGAFDLKPGSAMKPLPGIKTGVFREDKTECGVGESGNLFLMEPFPSLARTIWNDHAKYVEQYWATFPGHYLTGDGARIDADGDHWLLGRVDDVISVAGHRIGAAEIEAALIAHPAVAEAAVVPVPDEIKGEAIYTFVTLKDGFTESEDLKKQLINQVRNVVGPIATPKTIQISQGLPKTRSGKIMRRLLRKIAGGSSQSELGDTTTLLDPSVIESLIKGRL